MATATQGCLVGRKPLAKLRAEELKHLIRLSLEARWPKAPTSSDLTGRVNDAVV
jgi:hypothetical protein